MSEPAAPIESQLKTVPRVRHGRAVIDVSGPLQWPDAAQLADSVQSLRGRMTSVVLDVTAVTSIDSTGIAVLASVAAQLQHDGIEVRIVADEEVRRRLPRIAGLHNIFKEGPT
jgi:anti-anti-sigma factor